MNEQNNANIWFDRLLGITPAIQQNPIQFYFYQQRGTTVVSLTGYEGGMGVWGQPFQAASGSYSGAGPSGTSSVCVYGLDVAGFRNNDCTTIIPVDTNICSIADSGALLVFMRNALPGTYRVLARVTIYSHVFASYQSIARVTWRGAIPNDNSIQGNGGANVLQTQYTNSLPIWFPVVVLPSNASVLVAQIDPVVVVHTQPGTTGYSAGLATGTITVEGYNDPNGVFHSSANYKHEY